MTQCLRSLLAVGSHHVRPLACRAYAGAAAETRSRGGCEEADPPPAEKPFAELIKEASPQRAFQCVPQRREVYPRASPGTARQELVVSLTCASGLGDAILRGADVRRDADTVPQRSEERSNDREERALRRPTAPRPSGNGRSSATRSRRDESRDLPHPSARACCRSGRAAADRLPMQAFMLE